GPVCPPRQHYELQGPPCPPTCANPAGGTDADCSGGAGTEGCFCDAGFLRSGSDCVPLARCGCHHAGRYYRAGEEFVPCPRCSQRCVCHGGTGAVECQPAACGAGEVCSVRDGTRGCYAEGCGRCQALGAGSYGTFDGHRVVVAGAGTYQMAAVDAAGPDDPVVPFAVEVEKEEGADGPVIRRLAVTAHGVAIGMARGARWEVTVDGERHLLPLALAGGAVTVTQEGAHRVLRVPGGGPALLYDGDAYALLTLPVSYRRRPRG
ncbi:FCGBP protein, partial [Corythaeola cristata]|nr:FCGBP protein [Corythaeola cristata]